MPCLITTRSASKKITRKNNNSNNKKEKQKFYGKNSYPNLKAPSDNVKLQSDKTLTTQQMGLFLNETR